MKLELHFEKPPPLHNDDKVKRAIVKSIQNRKDSLCNSTAEFDTLIKDFFGRREKLKPHGNIRYRIITRTERERKKFDVGLSENDSACKFGCTENKLVRWCAKCNDREKLRQKEKQLERNLARLKITTDRKLVGTVNSVNLQRKDESESFGVSSLEELKDYIEELTLNEVEYEHLYAEGISLTVADLLLYTYMYHLLVSVSLIYLHGYR